MYEILAGDLLIISLLAPEVRSLGILGKQIRLQELRVGCDLA